MLKITFVVAAFLAFVAVQASPAEDVIPIVDQQEDVHPDGHYHYSYETGNGIKAFEHGEPREVEKEPGFIQTGGYEYKGDDGQTYSIKYVADENGYQPEGDHLPVAPEIPPQIARALAYLATAAPPKDDKF